MNKQTLTDRVLAEVKRHKGITLTALQRALRLSHRSRAQYHLNKLLAAGQVVREGFCYYFNSMVMQEFTELPFYGSVQAGTRAITRISQTPDDYYPVPTKLLPHRPKELMLFRVRGTSMHPTIPERSMVICRMYRPGEYLRDKQIIIAEHKGNIKIKRFVALDHHGLLISDNHKQYEPIPFNDDSINIIALYLNKLG